jgi:NAD(P)-dependent dehydrogenase (short-subunit alcohol dehydrogenase family)
MGMIHYDFTGQVFMVTGATGNLGRAVVHAGISAGAQVVLLDRNAARQAELYADLDAEKHLMLGDVDIANVEQVEQAMATAVQRYGRIDALAHTVGGFAAGKAVHETPLEMWDSMLALNARNTFIICRTIIPHMLKQGHGKIVTVGAVAGTEGRANLSAYAASKAAMINLTETLSAEVRKHKINVNCVLPGTIDTLENRADMPDADHSRWVAPESLAAAILYLCSDGARDVHGVALPVVGLS